MKAHRSRGKPQALDLYGGAGGVCKGLQEAGYQVTGVDHEPQPDYPGEFIQADVMDLQVSLADFDLVWASPPCQPFSQGRNHKAKTTLADLIGPTRELLATHPVTVIENVPEAPLRRDLLLTGRYFSMRVPRRRIFELSFPCEAPLLVEPPPSGRCLVAAHGHGPADPAQRDARVAAGRPPQPAVSELEEALGIWHVVTGSSEKRRKALAEAIPPVYAEWIGLAALAFIRRAP